MPSPHNSISQMDDYDIRFAEYHRFVHILWACVGAVALTLAILAALFG